MLEVSVWAVRLVTLAVFAVGAGIGWWLRPRWPMPQRKPVAFVSARDRSMLH
jgi:hypothetical protein